MFRKKFKPAFLLISIFCIFNDWNVFPETGGLRDRPVSVVFVCEPSAKADKPRYYKSTSLFFKRLKNKRLQENGTAFFVGYGAFASETPEEQLRLAGQNGYDLYIFPQTASQNPPTSASTNAVPWISFVVEKKENIQPQIRTKPDPKRISPKQKRKNKNSKPKPDAKKSTGKPLESVPGEFDLTLGVGQTSGTNNAPTQIQSTSAVSKTKKGKNETSQKRKVSKTKSVPNSTSKKSKKNRKSDARTKPDSFVETSSSTITAERSKTIATSIGNSSFELSFDSLKFWFSTFANPNELSWTQDRILFLAGDKTAEEWNQILSGKPDDTTAIRLLNSAQDLRFNEGIYYTGCASSRIPNGISVLNFFFRGDRLIRLKQESFSLNSDGSGKSWELE
ncbi:hypothetical protein EHQ12_06575 [Leptospira gomenensis]|uniref:Uncharacterized protein n=1 Tax=Leptospira gomenensis TaxID=2484974 RepID=A0A5F1YSB2_9LEPT|nr:hypothetical protein [Leptospira gomenensis]TGK27891.1 hypothetical protein EHQ17_19295 [Leptospira gomenensis]TGK40995.1 hypothetical protein EHQ12_06575 [Leptospira gomenensis]TGK44964.1 hypothetical protein EHQ07_10860 [Leptospira gomenensis]TGK60794.1 hypothetical protein EHQ13_10660 [Leptospira gomenensis]